MFTISIEGDEAAIKDILSYTPFSFVSSCYQLWFCSLHGHSLSRNGIIENVGNGTLWLLLPLFFASYNGVLHDRGGFDIILIIESKEINLRRITIYLHDYMHYNDVDGRIGTEVCGCRWRCRPSRRSLHKERKSRYSSEAPRDKGLSIGD